MIFHIISFFYLQYLQDVFKTQKKWNYIKINKPIINLIFSDNLHGPTLFFQLRTFC